MDISSIATWKSSNASILKVSVNGEYGCASLTGVKVGKANVTCVYNGVASQAYAVTVADVTRLTMSKEMNVYTGSILNYISAEATLADGSTIYVNGPEAIWTTSNPKIAIVCSDTDVRSSNYRTLVYGVALGTANITCRFGNKSATCKVTVVNPPTVKSIVLSPSELVVPQEIEQSYRVDARALMSDGSYTHLEHGPDWISDNPAVASVDEFGQVTGLKRGTANITYEYDGVKSSNSCAVTVQ